MEIKTKHRIIGIVAIVALAIIIVPFFINRTQSSNINVKPAAQVPIADSSDGPAPQKQAAIEPSAEMTSTANEPHNAVPIEPQQIPANSNLATEPLRPVAQIPKTAVVSSNVHAKMSALENTDSNSKAKTSEAENTATESPVKNITKPTPVHEEATKPKKIPRNKNGSVKVMFAHQQSHHNLVAVKKEIKKTKLVDLHNAWAVQIGSFAQKNNADKLVQQLRSKGFAAYVDRAKSGRMTVERVFVGPEAKRAHAEELVKKLKHAFQLKGVVVKYKV